jgi:predicted TIM-barrel fold metal-dependent hydrolase
MPTAGANYQEATMTDAPRGDYAIVDGHVHFRGLEWTESLLELMEAVPLAAINTVSTPNPDTINQNAEQIYLKAQYPGRFYASGGLDYVEVAAQGAMDDPARRSALLGAQVHKLKAIGFDGLKLIDGKPTARQRHSLPFDSPAYEEMWAALEALHYPCVCHVADPETFWDRERIPRWALENGWLYSEGDYPTKEGLYGEIDHVLARHPSLKIIFAHFYFLSADLERAAHFLDAHPTVCFDITPGAEMFNNFTRQVGAARAFFTTYQDRIVYGTDTSTWGFAQGGVEQALAKARYVRSFLEGEQPFIPSPLLPHWLEDDLEAIRPLSLPEAALLKIYHGNFQRMYGAQPAPLDQGAARAELVRMAAVIDARAGEGERPDNPAREVLERLG